MVRRRLGSVELWDLEGTESGGKGFVSVGRISRKLARVFTRQGVWKLIYPCHDKAVLIPKSDFKYYRKHRREYDCR